MKTWWLATEQPMIWLCQSGAFSQYQHTHDTVNPVFCNWVTSALTATFAPGCPLVGNPRLLSHPVLSDRYCCHRPRCICRFVCTAGLRLCGHVVPDGEDCTLPFKTVHCMPVFFGWQFIDRLQAGFPGTVNQNNPRGLRSQGDLRGSRRGCEVRFWAAGGDIQRSSPQHSPIGQTTGRWISGTPLRCAHLETQICSPRASQVWTPGAFLVCSSEASQMWSLDDFLVCSSEASLVWSSAFRSVSSICTPSLFSPTLPCWCGGLVCFDHLQIFAVLLSSLPPDIDRTHTQRRGIWVVTQTGCLEQANAVLLVDCVNHCETWALLFLIHHLQSVYSCLWRVNHCLPSVGLCVKCEPLSVESEPLSA